VVAMELLNGFYMDIEVRSFAVRSLSKNMKDEEVNEFLLELVQALKNEPYYDSQLARFLLNRAFKCRRLGHNLFWSLR
jgi:phosphatidylinositol-4,5-bisphosphate 3-kinase catalytic subunit gamma